MANVLVIDDDKMICEGFVETIEPMGHNVQFALNLKEFLLKNELTEKQYRWFGYRGL